MSDRFKAAAAAIIFIVMLACTANAAGDIFQVLGEEAQFTTTSSLFNKAGMSETLKGPGPYTVFAPIEYAYRPLTITSMDQLSDNPSELSKFSGNHVVPGRLTIDDLSRMSSVTTINGLTLPVTNVDGIVNVGNARVSGTGIPASNGIVYPVDSLMIPGAKPPGDYKQTSLNEYPMEVPPPETTFDWALMLLSFVLISAIVIYLLGKALFGKRTEY